MHPRIEIATTPVISYPRITTPTKPTDIQRAKMEPRKGFHAHKTKRKQRQEPPELQNPRKKPPRKESRTTNAERIGAPPTSLPASPPETRKSDFNTPNPPPPQASTEPEMAAVSYSLRSRKLSTRDTRSGGVLETLTGRSDTAVKKRGRAGRADAVPKKRGRRPKRGNPESKPVKLEPECAATDRRETGAMTIRVKRDTVTDSRRERAGRVKKEEEEEEEEDAYTKTTAFLETTTTATTTKPSPLTWPPLSSESFGLIQEELDGNPFHVLIAAILSNRTSVLKARPVVHQLISAYPTPSLMASQSPQEIEALVQPLGLKKRGPMIVEMAREWLAHPPMLGTYYDTKKSRRGYPVEAAGFRVPGQLRYGVELGARYEVDHLKGVGAYGIDSWRIFCRDGLAGSEGEWKRVVTDDKPLRSYLRWRWAKEEGVVWEEEGDEEVGRGYYARWW